MDEYVLLYVFWTEVCLFNVISKRDTQYKANLMNISKYCGVPSIPKVTASAIGLDTQINHGIIGGHQMIRQCPLILHSYL